MMFFYICEEDLDGCEFYSPKNIGSEDIFEHSIERMNLEGDNWRLKNYGRHLLILGTIEDNNRNITLVPAILLDEDLRNQIKLLAENFDTKKGVFKDFIEGGVDKFVLSFDEKGDVNGVLAFNYDSIKRKCGESKGISVNKEVERDLVKYFKRWIKSRHIKGSPYETK